MLSALLLLSATAGSADLVALAAASGRPPECLPAPGEGQGAPRSVWHRARHPKLARYCQLLARAHARLQHDPDQARAAARAAAELLPGRAAPQVVLARAALADGDLTTATDRFAAALGHDPQSVEQPLAMHDLALTHLRSGRLTEALAVLRVLAPRAALLPDRAQRVTVLLEAAHASMAAAAGAPVGASPRLDEALAYLREAARDRQQGPQVDVALSLVLVLDRAGMRAQADALLAEQRGAAGWARHAEARYVAVAADRLVLQALGFELEEPARAIELLGDYLAGEGGSGPWAQGVRSRLERLQAATRTPARTTARGRP